jgi:tryptophan 2,3-dioxygenase
LYPASGFQSIQNRMIENKLGLQREARLTYNSMPYTSFVSPEEKKHLEESEKETSLFTLIDGWLARTPFLQTDSFDFWKTYQTSVKQLFNEDREVIRKHPILTPEEKERNLKQVDANEETFASLFDEAKYSEIIREGRARLSYRAMHAVLLIQLYRDQPVLQLPFQLITALQDIDELMTTWRYRHALMVHRMLGRKIGTGGSSGADYLKAATDKHRIFSDFFNLATFFIPRSKLPPLPQEMKKQLGFHYSV